MKRSKAIKIILCVSLFLGLERFCHFQTAGFRLTKASTAHIYPFSTPSTPPPQSLYQPFYYLGKGVQFYVFIGEDGQTILKLFKHHHAGLSTDALKTLLPLQIRAPILQRREKRMVRLLKSAELALNQLGKETAVFYVHLNKTETLGQIALYDRLGVKHQLDLDQTEFLLQKRVIPLEEKLHALFCSNQSEKAFSLMKDLVVQIEARSKKGIKNKDGRIIQNCGFLGCEPIELDIGSMMVRSARSKNPNPHRKARMKATTKLLKWVETHYPEHLSSAKDKLENPS